MLGGADNPNGELLSYIIGADRAIREPPISLFSPLFWVGFTPQLVRFNKLQSPLAGVVPATVSRINAEITFAPELTGASYVINCARARDMEFED